MDADEKAVKKRFAITGKITEIVVPDVPIQHSDRMQGAIWVGAVYGISAMRKVSVDAVTQRISHQLFFAVTIFTSRHRLTLQHLPTDLSDLFAVPDFFDRLLCRIAYVWSVPFTAGTHAAVGADIDTDPGHHAEHRVLEQHSTV